MRRSAQLVGGLVLALGALGFTCSHRGAGFSHQQHVSGQGLECKDCHTGSADGVRAGAPDPEQCRNCHQEADKYAGWAKLFTENWPRLKGLPEDGKFSHQKHQEAGVECESCHGRVAKSKRVTGEILPDEATCRNCHQEMGVGNDCAVCHQKLDSKTAPSDHAQAWASRHGPAAQDPVRGERCFRCHARTTCATCHQVEKPQDHTYAWKNLGHGAAAGLDRNRCAVCHRSDSCVRCHRETPPESHRAGWDSRHCRECHLTDSAGNCTVCHGARISHREAPTRPAGGPHSRDTDCRACHQGYLLRHPDNGDNCRSCHQ